MLNFIKIKIHELFHGHWHDTLLRRFGRDVYEHDYDERDFYKCNKCGIITEEFTLYDNVIDTEVVRITFKGIYNTWQNYYLDDTLYKKELTKLMARELMK